MPVPTFDQFIEPLLRYLAVHADGAAITHAYEAIADEVDLTQEDRMVMLPSGGQATFKSRIGWAHDRLKRAGLSENPRPGFWKLTPEGVALAATNKRFSAEETERLASGAHTARLRLQRDIPVDSSIALAPPLDKASPEERIDAALAELRESVSRDLLESIGHAPPALFEQLVLKLLKALGYEPDRSTLERVGDAGDGGFDVIISLDRLGLEKVYVHAKRAKNAISSAEMQNFMGALQLRSASKGMFITTSSFTKDAKTATARTRASIVLVDGDHLASLMIDHSIGVSHKTFQMPKVDSDYFEER